MVSIKQLQDMANVLRVDSIEATTSAQSGHPTSCMSSAEIMATLFFDEMSFDIKNPENPNNDEFVLSKGHAAPILYSALYRAGAIKHDLKKLRKLTSPLEGHPMPRSLSWIKVATGSLGQGLSVGLGMALAAKLQKRNFNTFVLLGDSEVAEGSIYEAFDLAKFYKLNNLCAVVDINRLGQTGETIFGHNIQAYKKIFKSFGWNVITINGHDIKQLKKAFSNFRKQKSKPTVILAKTYKGKGVSFLENKEGWHGKPLKLEESLFAKKEILGQTNLVPKSSKMIYLNELLKTPKIKIKKPKGRPLKRAKLKMPKLSPYEFQSQVATRDAYGKALANLAKLNPQILATDAETGNSTRTEEVKKVAPEQFIQTFIAEQNMIGLALGLSLKGFNVFAATFAAFLSRAHDQIRMATYSSADFNICGSHVGVSIGEDGASQMGLEDIAIFRDLPNSTVFYPSDAISTEKLTQLSAKIKGITYLRTTRPKTPVIYTEKDSFPVGDFKIVKQSSKDKTILVGSGITLHESIKAHEKLKDQGVATAVVDLYCIKPFKTKKFINFVKKHGGKIIITEDHYQEGGIGEMLSAELELSKQNNIKLKLLNVKGIPHSGKMEELLKKYKIDSSAIIKEAKKLIKKR